MNDIICDTENFKVIISDTSGSDTACLRFEGSCSQPGFLQNADEIIEKVKHVEYNSIFIDVEELKSINSRFIGLLIVLIGSDKFIGIKNPSQYLQDLLEMTGILKLFHIYENFSEFAEGCGGKDTAG
ncbi:hypothetical protein ACFL6F_03315 [Planctomycetota bacterium]